MEVPLPILVQLREKMVEETFFNTANFPNITWKGEGQWEVCSVSAPGFKALGLTIAYIIIFIFSVFGNALVVFVVSYMKSGRTSTDIYLMNLAIADILFSLALPFWAVYVYSGWIFGTALCKILSGFQEASVYGGVFLLACISIDRYFAIVHAKRSLSSHKVLVKVVCGVVWVVAGMLALPVVVQRESMYLENIGEHICFENVTRESSDRWRVSMYILRHTVGFFLPLAIMSVCYGRTILKLYHTRNQHKHKAMRFILAVVLSFIVCWLPFNASVLIDILIRGGSLPVESCQTLYTVEKMLNVPQVLAFTHCMVNPILYAFIGQKFRNQLLSALNKHGVISKRFQQTHQKSSVNSVGSFRSRNTSVTV
uniref:C-X-C chemokine receptor type 2 n=1 Tax=Knipowitschia caucasica TaxID=637954 RepID=A0AAV2K4R1_KNICA